MLRCLCGPDQGSAALQSYVGWATAAPWWPSAPVNLSHPAKRHRAGVVLGSSSHAHSSSAVALMAGFCVFGAVNRARLGSAAIPDGPAVAGGGIGDGMVPLGRLANAELQRWRNTAHAMFDPLWKSGSMSRVKDRCFRAGAQSPRRPRSGRPAHCGCLLPLSSRVGCCNSADVGDVILRW